MMEPVVGCKTGAYCFQSMMRYLIPHRKLFSSSVTCTPMGVHYPVHRRQGLATRTSTPDLRKRTQNNQQDEDGLVGFMKGLETSVEGVEGVEFVAKSHPVHNDEEDARLAEQFMNSPLEEPDGDVTQKKSKRQKNPATTSGKASETQRKTRHSKRKQGRNVKAEELTRKGFRVDDEGNIYHGNALIPPQYRALVFDPAVIRTKRDRILERKAKALQQQDEKENIKRGKFTTHREKRKSGYKVDYGEHLTRRQLRVAQLVDDGLDACFSEDTDEFLDTTGFAIDHVDITRDMRVATVHWTCLGQKEKVEKVLFNRSAKIRARLVEHIRMKFAPELVFKCLPDSSYEADIDRLLDTAMQQDELTKEEVGEKIH